MYIVVKNGKKTKHTFTTYEHARQFVRKLIRKNDKGGLRHKGQPAWFMQDYGFEIITK